MPHRFSIFVKDVIMLIKIIEKPRTFLILLSFDYVLHKNCLILRGLTVYRDLILSRFDSIDSKNGDFINLRLPKAFLMEIASLLVIMLLFETTYSFIQ